MVLASYHVVNSDSGCMRCLATVGPILGTNATEVLCSQFPFSLKPSSCTASTELNTSLLLFSGCEDSAQSKGIFKVCPEESLEGRNTVVEMDSVTILIIINTNINKL